MTLVPGQTLHGFRLDRREHVVEVDSEALVFEHIVTGAELVVLSNDDSNKVFMITFKTPPSDDTGVAHILEHSVLNGSAKYPVKEPFAELLKSSQYTFLNAMTYPDKTVYPVASLNPQDFTNLMDVYLDAVFQPILSRNTFLQEGWHHALEEPDGELEFSGVVYNEMLGASSDPDGALSDEVDKALFPHSTYGINSGGDPEAIPDLTYEAFVDFHRQFYHPSNSRIVLAGDFDVAEKLEHLERYLGTFQRLDVDATIITQPPFEEPRSHHGTYPVDPADDTAAKTYALRSWLMDSPVDPEYAMATTMLGTILCGSPASPLRKALVDSHLGEDTLNWGVQSELAQSWFAFGLRGTEPERVADMEALIDSTLQRLVTDGIDPRTIESSLNSIEFRLREANYGGYPKGLIHALGMMQGWLYGGDPIAHLRYEEPLAAIKAKVAAGGFFEGMIQRWLIDNPHRVTVVMTPDREHEARRVERLEARLAAQHAAMSEADRLHIVAQCAELEAAQLRPDTPEALATIPRLPIASVPRQAEEYPFQIVQTADSAAGYSLSFAPQPTRGIAYLKLTFDATGLPTELLPYVPIFGRITTQAGTLDRDYVALMQEIGIHTGGLGSGYHCTDTLGGDLISSFGYNGKALLDKLPVLVDLATEVITRADLGNLKRIDEILRAARASVQARFVSSGHSYAMCRLGAYHSRSGMYGELTGGLAQFDFLGSLVDALDRSPEVVLENLRRVRDYILTRQALHVHLTGSDAELAALQAAMPTLIAALPERTETPVAESLPELTRGEALVVPSKIQYVGKGCNLKDFGYEYTGAFEVLNKYLNRDYLWNKVRVQGNAYGCFSSFNYLDGDFACCSYRDPNLAETLDTFDAIGETLEHLEISPRDFENLQISTMGGIDSPHTPDQKGAIAYNRWQCGITQDFVQRRREQILDATPDDLRAHAPLFKRFAAEGAVCVVGGDAAITECRDRFASVRNVFGGPTRGEDVDDDSDDDE